MSKTPNITNVRTVFLYDDAKSNVVGIFWRDNKNFRYHVWCNAETLEPRHSDAHNKFVMYKNSDEPPARTKYLDLVAKANWAAFNAARDAVRRDDLVQKARDAVAAKEAQEEAERQIRIAQQQRQERLIEHADTLLTQALRVAESCTVPVPMGDGVEPFPRKLTPDAQALVDLVELIRNGKKEG